MKKAVKILLFVIAMFVTVNVKASSVTLIEDPAQVFFEDISDVSFHFKKVQGNDSAYAFCLDSNLDFISGSLYDSVNSIS